ncbi:tripartite tricarboxylate transporter substrate binding protein [Bradyrhizobium sp. 190]|uniref:Bug family tripartite tricarboxylate transporter substrate binding protein n=1 Tax=Bradyrhizobium sp. 190 TaxID=2782658 RepID=UPI001FFBE5B7|nr:tripartite tricarboxylate transporter substrate binding protein [Bradyrhizobium sp. 190]MCK1513155.1 tripartite tricarboxylate transporter substrate binding protein [Bradyrhizobium sp. 190]
MTRRRFIASASASAAAGLTLSLPVAVAEGSTTFPDRTIIIQVPYAAGGGSDTITRLVARKMSENISLPVVIENRAGGGGSIASLAVKVARPDGYTILMGHTGTHVFNPVMFPKDMRYDPINDFSFITPMVRFDTALVVPYDHPAKSVKDLIELSRTKPGGLTFGSSGVGDTAHLIGEMFKARARIATVHVPYRGLAPALTDLIAGRLDFIFSSYLSAGPYLESNNLRAIAWAGEARSPKLPDVPTMAEAGTPGVGIETWFGFMAPKETPPEIIDKLNAEFVRAINSEGVKTFVEARAASIFPLTPAVFAARVASDITRVRQIVQEAKIDTTTSVAP